MTFDAGQTQKQIAVRTLTNIECQADRHVEVQITGVTGPYLAFAPTGTVTIRDDD
jgi:hypothetical protein